MQLFLDLLLALKPVFIVAGAGIVGWWLIRRVYRIGRWVAIRVGWITPPKTPLPWYHPDRDLKSI